MGHIVSESEIATDPEKVDVVKHWKEPTDNLPDFVDIITGLLQTTLLLSVL